MNGTPTPIEIFKPFGEAYELMKKMLFQPFDFSKWCVVAFAAFLAGNFGGGGGGGGNFGRSSHGKSASGPWPGSEQLHQHWPWLVVLIVVGALVILALIFVLMWIRARGTFIFTDCIVHNRGAIKQPWREYRRQGNSYFLFSLVFGFAMMMIIAVVAGIFFLLIWLVNLPDPQKTVVFVILGVFVFLAWMFFCLLFGLVSYFMAPVMYVRRCLAMDAFRDVLHLVRAHMTSFILFGLFMFVLFLALMVVGMIMTCATCCLAALPYVGTVIMLPALVWIRGFGLLFLRQFGPAYDVWSGNPPMASPLPPSSPPTVPA